jgi:phage protein D
VQLIYQGTDITPFVDISKCVHRDVSGGRSDSVDMELEHAAAWHRWGPEIDDEIRLIQGGLDTGVMYLNTIWPEDGRYRLVATSLPAAARRKAWKSYHDMTLEDILRACAAECRMSYGLYGLEGGMRYPYLERRDEGCAAFLDRLMALEGGVFKVIGGRLCGIGILWAQEQKAARAIELTAGQEGVQHIRRDGDRWAGLTVRAPWGEAAARDSRAAGDIWPVKTDLPARDAAQAGRWARGLLMQHNRRTEQLRLNTELNTAMTAMARVDIQSGAAANGEWLADEATHDLINRKTQTALVRCITDIS